MGKDIVIEGWHDKTVPPLKKGKRWFELCSVVVVVLLLGGCSAATSVVGKVAATAAAPVFGLAVRDAETTLLWVERELEAGRLSDSMAVAARKCPEAVITLDEMRAELGEVDESEDGFKGLIYYGTVGRFGQDLKTEATVQLQNLLGSCMVLIPAEKMLKLL